MRAEEIDRFDTQQRMFNLRTEIEEITVMVRELRRRHAAAGYEQAAARLSAAQAQLQQLSKPPRKTLGMPAP